MAEDILVSDPWPVRIPEVPASPEPCAECGCKVSIADTSRPLIAARPDMRILCRTCARRYVDEHPEMDRRQFHADRPDEPNPGFQL